ncbi:dTMP kinase [Saccharolobus solfataricus]|uniref:Probable thymidylate kinase 2 n=3 Tax=Saccharolobus solfataricus TaxID=2287 RepID=KTHY2_SACS2|nr:dTMP kinase [Saccharolobus solfataricus]P58157.1 RecName: Full=Probable thymidylate kinase 2; AltName: Full=dTMP kinase 2 [Saccharolobus solfataricus P2]AAK41441.1 Thymidylate kinase (tmK-2) [Saccharolobus solfataricus P2]AKA74380.1 dTMP kinase [Saccharolobus solfataricus]AKA77076.1 dTMP kinase [Saccharolobus solfataricus]AKA79768.1 dTMP kinase [Saccharolobus solfataricus]AZF68862.1 dTMP kinase [Saccharolobus solfataricus]
MRGLLIAFEGIDGSGKSSQAVLLKDWIEMRRDVYLTEWNSSEWIHDIIKEAKKKNMLTSITFSLIHATDFSDRYERYILPMLKSGFVVICDRYVYTAYARDVVRNVDFDWVKRLYSFAIKPNFTFYIRVTPEIALERIRKAKRKIKPQEAGIDILGEIPLEEGFLKYQSRIVEIYDKIAKEESNFITIDGNRPLKDVQIDIRKILGEYIDNSL